MTFTLSFESIATGLKALALSPTTALIPSLLGTNVGWLLRLLSKGTNCVEFGKEKGATTPVMDLLSNTKVTVWGSATNVGLYQVMFWPTLISVFFGKN